MQFIERNLLNVRSAVYHLKKNGCQTEFLLFPMVHVGSQTFYDEISRRLTLCDLILAEGVVSRRASLLTLSYRVVSKIKRMDLVTQIEGLSISEFRGKTVNSDLAGKVFDQRWSSLPLLLRLEMFVVVPLFALYLLLFGTREMLAENLAFEDLPSTDEVLEDDRFEPLDSLVIDERDRSLIAQIERLHNAGEKEVVGILYGAHHMRNATNFLLDKLNYRVAKAEWVTVFDL